MYCKECGFQLSDDAKFCPNCGTKVELNGIGNIKQKAVFGKIEEDSQNMVSESVEERAEWKRPYEPTLSEYNNKICSNYRKKIINEIKSLRKEVTGYYLKTTLITLVLVGCGILCIIDDDLWILGVIFIIGAIVSTKWCIYCWCTVPKQQLSVYEKTLLSIESISFDDVNYKKKVINEYDICIKKCEEIKKNFSWKNFKLL